MFERRYFDTSRIQSINQIQSINPQHKRSNDQTINQTESTKQSINRSNHIIINTTSDQLILIELIELNQLISNHLSNDQSFGFNQLTNQSINRLLDFVDRQFLICSVLVSRWSASNLHHDESIDASDQYGIKSVNRDLP